MKRLVLLLGAGSGIGRAVARGLAAAGHDLLLAGRDPVRLEADAADLAIRHGRSARTARFDAEDEASHAQLVRDWAGEGDVAGVVACHGSLADEAPGAGLPEEARRVMTVNATSVISVFAAAGEILAERGSGFLCAVTSVAGERGRAKNALYGASKAAASTYLAGLDARLRPRGVAVVDVRPGFVDTRMTWSEPGLPLVAPPTRVARAVVRAVRRGRSVVYVPWFWRPVMGVLRLLPRAIFRRLPL